MPQLSSRRGSSDAVVDRDSLPAIPIAMIPAARRSHAAVLDVMQQRTVGRFEILRVIGRGGMAVVYLARQSDLGRLVALKELPAFHATDPSFAARFLRESRISASLAHPNIVTVYEYL